MLIRDTEENDFASIVRINTEAESFLNSQASLTVGGLKLLHGMAAYHRVACVDGAVAAFVLAFCAGTVYDDPNYLWFSNKYPNFLYVDRVIVGSWARGRGIGARMYDDLFAAARALKMPRLTCEIDCDPPNEVSIKFHRRFGFREVGRHLVDGGKKTVSLQEAPLE